MGVILVNLKEGDQFGYLTVIRESERRNGRRCYRCKCVCGKEIDVPFASLRSGSAKSCGCKRSEIAARTRCEEKEKELIGKTFNEFTVIDVLPPKNKGEGRRLVCKCSCGKTFTMLKQSLKKQKSCGHLIYKKFKMPEENISMTNHRAYPVLAGMIRRCENKKDQAYKYYGARGIKICDEWRNNPLSFFKWFDENYNDELRQNTIDRIDVNGDYCPENCRLVDMKTQQRNRTNNTLYDGKTAGEIGENLGIPQSYIKQRLTIGNSLEQIKAKWYELQKIRENDEWMNLTTFAKKVGLSKNAIAVMVSRHKLKPRHTPIFERVYFTEEDVETFKKTYSRKLKTYDGKSICEISRESGIPWSYIQRRLKKGKSIQEILDERRNDFTPRNYKKSQSE